MSTSASTSKRNGKKEAAASAGQMDPQSQLKEIQDLLFGQQVAEVRQSITILSEQNEKQFAEMGKKLDASIKALKKEFNAQLDDLTNHVNSLSEASDKRAALMEDDLGSLHGELDSFKQQTISAQDALEAQMFAEVEKLSTELDARCSELLDKLNDASGTLSSDKVGRAALAKLLATMASDLEGQSS